MLQKVEHLFLRMPHGLMSRLRIMLYKMLGMSIGVSNRLEKGRCRRLSQISIGNHNAFTQGFMLWPEDADYNNLRIKIGSKNYFNRNCMIDACGLIEIGDFNMFGPDVYITDSNHSYGNQLSPSVQPMNRGIVRVGNHCWIGAKVVILKDVTLGDYCVVAAGAVVNKSFPAGSVIGGVPARLLRD